MATTFVSWGLSPCAAGKRRRLAASERTRSKNSGVNSAGAGKFTSHVPAPPSRVSTKFSARTIGLLARKFRLKSVSNCSRQRPATDQAESKTTVPMIQAPRRSTQTVSPPKKSTSRRSVAPVGMSAPSRPYRIPAGKSIEPETRTSMVPSVIMVPKLRTGMILLDRSDTKPAAAVTVVQKMAGDSSTTVLRNDSRGSNVARCSR